MDFRCFCETNTIGERLEDVNLAVTSLSEGLRKPLQTFVETISGRSTGGLDVL